MDHGATVCAYLNAYRTEPDPVKRTDYSRIFSSYLLSLCWPKMHDRVMSWPFIGLIYNIRNMDTELLESARDEFDWSNYNPGPGDRSLVVFLASPNADRLINMVAEASGGPIMQLVQVLRSKAQDSEGFTTRFYTKETFMDFHRLFLGCFILYAKTLRSLKTLKRNSQPRVILETDPERNTKNAKIVACFDKLEPLNRLLLLIMSSHSFVTHLGIMAQTGALLPSFQRIGLYNKFKSVVIFGNDGEGNAKEDVDGEDVDGEDDKESPDNQVGKT